MGTSLCLYRHKGTTFCSCLWAVLLKELTKVDTTGYCIYLCQKENSNIIQLAIFQELKKHISTRGKRNKPCILNVKIMNRNMFTGIGDTLVFTAHVWRNGQQVFYELCTLAISLLAFAIILKEVFFFFSQPKIVNHGGWDVKALWAMFTQCISEKQNNRKNLFIVPKTKGFSYFNFPFDFDLDIPMKIAASEGCVVNLEEMRADRKFTSTYSKTCRRCTPVIEEPILNNQVCDLNFENSKRRTMTTHAI